jgi:hypothetical protein
MNDCQKYRDQWVAFVGGEIAPEDARAMAEHLESCRVCRGEVGSLRALFAETDAFREDLRASLASVDWEALPARIAAQLAGRTAAQPRKAGRPGFRARLWSPGFRPALAGLLVGLILGGAAMFFALKHPSGRRTTEGFFASREFLDRIELELARRQTLDYLDKSQYLILDVLERSGGGGSDRLAAREARELLSRKKYLNAELDKVGMVKAKDLCDQIELLVFELSQLSPEATAAELDRIQTLVRERQLLMKIRLVKRELERSEV